MTDDPITVMTVIGPVPAGDLGFTLPHEHVFCDTIREYRGSGLLNDETLACSELQHFAAAGGGTVVDLSTEEIGRDPAALRRVSEQVGVHIVMGTGHYRDPYLDRGWFDSHDVNEIAELIVRDATDGVGSTGVRAGIIGEIGSDKWYLSAAEERSFRAAARAHHRTGLTVSTHAARWPVGHAQLDLLELEGVDPARVIVGHVDTVPDSSYPLELARRGAWVQLDCFGTDTDYALERGIRYLRALADGGHLSRTLVSQDVFLQDHLVANGGHGYAFIATQVATRLTTEGFTQDEIRQLTHTNPQRALSGEVG
jgi:phosphotriesterase-related protein